ncbi:MAG: energy-coupled thiamine transporter ThiT [Clostridiales bacterium]|nr:energy-coupled thiamine transporter ThiT [Clostridiales bacterium]
MSAWFTQLIEGIQSLSAAVWIILASLILLGALLLFLRRQRWSARMISVGALSVAMAFLLSYIVVYRMPYGGSITPASMLPILAYGWVFGPGPGIAAGLVYGCLQLIQDPVIVHPAQVLLDYIFPFAALGLAGLFPKRLWLGILTAAFARFVFHYLAGFLFWGEYAPEGQPAMLYSLLYNGSYMLPETAVCLAIAYIPAVRRVLPRLRGAAAAKR